MKNLKKPLVLSLAAATVFFCVLSLAGCKKEIEASPVFYYKDYSLSLHIEKAEYTLSELEENNYIVPIDFIYTNDSSEAIEYDVDVLEVVSFGDSGMYTYAENMKYAPSTSYLSWTWGEDGYFGFENGMPSMYNFPKAINAGESFTIRKEFDFSKMYCGENSKPNRGTGKSIIYPPELASSNTSSEKEPSKLSYNFDYSLSDDETYLALGLDEYPIYVIYSIDGDESVPIQTGYYSLIFGESVFVNCIHITEE